MTECLDIGCGDLIFWKNNPLFVFNRYRTCKNYTGLDFSDEIIGRNKNKFPAKTFILSNAETHHNIAAKVVLCLDVLFHIVDDKTYEATLDNLISYTKDYLFIYTWTNKPRQLIVTVPQKYRKLDEEITRFNAGGLSLIEKYPVPFDPYGALYVFRRLPK